MMREIRKGDHVEFQGKPGKFDRPRGEVEAVWAQAKPDGSLGRMCRVVYPDGTLHNTMDDRLKRIHKFSDGQQVSTVDTGDAHLDWHPAKRSGQKFGISGKVLALFDTQSGNEPYYSVRHDGTSAYYDEDELESFEVSRPEIKGGSMVRIIEPAILLDGIDGIQELHRQDLSTPHVGSTGRVSMRKNGICTVMHDDFNNKGSQQYHVSELILLGSTDYIVEQLDEIDKALDGLKLNEKQ